MIKVIVTGALGRMGSNNIRFISKNKERYRLVGATEREDCPYLGEDVGEILGLGKLGVVLDDNLADCVEDGDVIIDFLFPGPTLANLAVAVEHKTPMVIGTTGFSAEQIEEIKKAAQVIPIVLGYNMSVGINLLLGLVKKSAEILGAEYDVEIVEMHHRHKKDAPSGTAIALGRSVAEGLKLDFDENTIYGRKGFTGERGNEIGIHAVRGGDVVGDHTVIFATEGERIEFVHKASSRDTFSKGALRAAEWLQDKGPGLYSMADVLGLRI